MKKPVIVTEAEKTSETEVWGNAKGVEVSSVTENSSGLTTTITNNEHETMAKNEKRMTKETRQSILRSLGISDDDVGVSFREDKTKDLVRVQRGKWLLHLYNNSWTGARIFIAEYAPKGVNISLIRNMVSHVYEIKYHKCMVEFLLV